MNKLILLPLFLLLWSASLFAAGDQYALGVDGLGCPFCAYGIEKTHRPMPYKRLSTMCPGSPRRP